ncbi:MAG: hypothetical protein PWQ16_160 [bacterium]|nr:hypothetical protein [bacterium]
MYSPLAYKLERLRAEIENFKKLPWLSPEILKALTFLEQKLSPTLEGRDVFLLERLFMYLLRSSRMDIPWALKAYLEEETGLRPIVSTYDGWIPTYYPTREFFLLLLPERILEEPLLYPFFYGLYLRWRGMDIVASDESAIRKYGDAYKFSLLEVLFSKAESRLKGQLEIAVPVLDGLEYAVCQLRDSLPPIDSSLPVLFNAGWVLVREGMDRKSINELIMTTLKLRAFRKEWQKAKNVSDPFSGDNQSNR